ncbi:uncharacterized protein LOC133897961 [Phragmites australis]|uniref:uncharacterized protein LOC133897961 n=1 Tax=Phragmites australis TaxID=29695 RepID=UPI002D79EC72|nr:uncharacterized protein LOC133897961 [Phragmites australis]
MARSPYLQMEERVQVQVPEQGARRGGIKDQLVEQEKVLLVHSQVRRIKQEDEEIRERLLKLQLLETRPAGGFYVPVAARRVLRSLSPLRRAGNSVSVAD